MNSRNLRICELLKGEKDKVKVTSFFDTVIFENEHLCTLKE
jgi:hypothetical protein